MRKFRPIMGESNSISLLQFFTKNYFSIMEERGFGQHLSLCPYIRNFWRIIRWFKLPLIILPRSPAFLSLVIITLSLAFHRINRIPFCVIPLVLGLWYGDTKLLLAIVGWWMILGIVITILLYIHCYNMFPWNIRACWNFFCCNFKNYWN